jgi:hypothetical protein
MDCFDICVPVFPAFQLIDLTCPGKIPAGSSMHLSADINSRTGKLDPRIDS